MTLNCIPIQQTFEEKPIYFQPESDNTETLSISFPFPLKHYGKANYWLAKYAYYKMRELFGDDGKWPSV